MSETNQMMYSIRFRIAWWLEGCPFTGWRRPDKIPWDYRLGMRIMPTKTMYSRLRKRKLPTDV